MKTQSRPMFDTLESRNLMAADLYISAINVPQVVQTQGVDAEAIITITNRGDTPVAKGVTVKFAFSRDNVWGNDDDIMLGNRVVQQTIPAGGTAQLIYQGRAAGQPQGVFRLGAQVDSKNAVVEANERNNTALSEANAVTYYYPMENNTTWGKIGTSGNDHVTFSHRKNMAIVTVNNRVYAQSITGVDRMIFDAGLGNDVIIADPDFPIDLAITGSGGDDVIIGGAGNDELSGANGRDRVFGGKGDDLILGGGSNDRLAGEDGNDTISGNRGHDMLFGGAGQNELWGGEHNDRLISSGNNAIDKLFGGAGTDTADADVSDLLADIEG